MIHSLLGGGKHYRGFTALSKKIGTPDARGVREKGSDYVKEHKPLKYLRKKIAHYLHDFHSHWFASFGLPPSNGLHKQLYGSDIRWLLRRVQHRCVPQGGGRGKDREIQVFSSLDIGHKDFLGCQFVNCKPFPSHHNDVKMDFVFFIQPLPFYDGTLAEFEASLDSCWYGRVVACGAPFQRPREDSTEGQGRQPVVGRSAGPCSRNATVP